MVIKLSFDRLRMGYTTIGNASVYRTFVTHVLEKTLAQFQNN